MDEQNRNQNRGAYRQEENTRTEGLPEGDKIFVNTETYKREGTERPDAYIIDQTLRNQPHKLFKLHGDIDNISGRVLLEEEYDKLYAEDGPFIKLAVPVLPL